MARCEDAFAGVTSDSSDDEDDAKKAWACAFAAPEIRALDETQLFWFFHTGKIVGVTYRRLDDLPAEIMRDAGVDQDDDDVDDDSDRSADPSSGEEEEDDSEDDSEDEFARTTRGPIHGSFLGRASSETRSLLRLASRAVLARSRVSASSSPSWSFRPRATSRRAPRHHRDVASSRNSTYAKFWPQPGEASTAAQRRPRVFRARDSYLTMTEEQYDAHDNFGYDQYETCVPLRRAGACARARRRDDRRRTGAAGRVRLAGFRSQGLVRFVNAESAHLSPSNRRAAGACMYVNVEDYVRFATRPNASTTRFRRRCACSDRTSVASAPGKSRAASRGVSTAPSSGDDRGARSVRRARVELPRGNSKASRTRFGGTNRGSTRVASTTGPSRTRASATSRRGADVPRRENRAPSSGTRTARRRERDPKARSDRSRRSSRATAVCLSDASSFAAQPRGEHGSGEWAWRYDSSTCGTTEARRWRPFVASFLIDTS